MKVKCFDEWTVMNEVMISNWLSLHLRIACYIGEKYMFSKFLRTHFLRLELKYEVWNKFNVGGDEVRKWDECVCVLSSGNWERVEPVEGVGGVGLVKWMKLELFFWFGFWIWFGFWKKEVCLRAPSRSFVVRFLCTVGTWLLVAAAWAALIAPIERDLRGGGSCGAAESSPSGAAPLIALRTWGHTNCRRYSVLNL